jgi:nuclear transport factor 2 (NTF2) superfamily protein
MAAAGFRSYGNENGEFDAGFMRTRHVRIHDVSIEEADGRFRWPQGRRPETSTRV